MKKYLIIYLPLIFFCLANQAMASLPNKVSYATPGFVIGADAGWGTLNTPEGNMWTEVTSQDVTFLSQSHDIGGFVWGAHGGYDFGITPNVLLGFQVGYKDLGRSKYNSQRTENNHLYKLSRKIDQQAIDALFTLHYYVWRGLNFFGNIGAALIRSTTEQKYYDDENPNNLAPYNDKETKWDINPELVLGVGYTLSNHLDIHILYNYIYGHTNTGQMGDEWAENRTPNPPMPAIYAANLIMAGITYTF